MIVKNAIHIHVSDFGIKVMILVDGDYHEYLYRDWKSVIAAHYILLAYFPAVHIFVR